MFSDLILLRLLAAPAEGEIPSKIKDDLQPLSDSALSREELQRHFDDLTARGLIAPRGKRRYSLTADGRRAVRERFQVRDELSATKRWVQLRDRYLTALALRIAGDAAALDRIAKADGLRAAILKKRYAPDLRQIPELPKLVDHLVAKAVGARRATPGEFRQALIRNWLSAEGASEHSQAQKPQAEKRAELPLEAFASEVRKVAAQTPSGRFGDHKVFISHVWQQLKARGLEGLAGGYERFKQRLIEANTKGLLALSRADLTAAFAREDLDASQAGDSLSTFHFIQI